MLKEKESYIKNFMGFLDVWMAWMSFHITMSVIYNRMVFFVSTDILLTNIFILLIWYGLSKFLHLNEVYRSRPLSVILYNCVLQGFGGVAFLSILLVVFNLYYPGVKVMAAFMILSIVLCFGSKMVIYKFLKFFRRRGLNTRNILFVGDKSGLALLNKIHKHFEWGYKILGVVGDESLRAKYGNIYPFFERSNIDSILTGRSIDELVYACDYENVQEIQRLMDSCREVGVTFRLYSPFMNMLTQNTHIHYFDTQAVLTVSNTPDDFIKMLTKRTFDIVMSGLTILFLSPVYLGIALLIKIDSKGPVFFSQKRVGLRGRRFNVHKFRTMVVNAEELKSQLMKHNEMDGPVFKMADDPRITRVGKFLRKTSLDELPQFFNVLVGDMSIVGPRPPVPSEVVQYERWQVRRLSMRPGITCLWQIAPSRNDISFEEWMRMDMEYIDNWSLRLDFIIILKTVRTVLRADGK
jgi:exopolysaccharide biosynthesis polyprenyl glycosylphosphotransferase